jgi:hypothetical protein
MLKLHLKIKKVKSLLETLSNLFNSINLLANLSKILFNSKKEKGNYEIRKKK